MKILAKVDGILFVQTHSINASVIAYAGHTELQIAVHYAQEDDEMQYITIVEGGTTRRIGLMTESEWENAELFIE